ncbi:unnamed protein product [Bursaphelenchus xylophilus]|uniref:(pine wood nematode) hypothetical protein n=1 Tax=Bursaphelenchus xylophilus TaxID=6326 RepID=A0A1I7SCP5_BURXY|nr:unnamed protein product [Bursaphelenchus xylophilus]CAG9093738.1 unnamed protein product [Bursaphelenchus xylophilus]
MRSFLRFFAVFLMFTMIFAGEEDEMSLKRILDVKSLAKLISDKTAGIRVLDCTYAVGPKPDYKQFKEQWYAKFERLMARPTQQKALYLQSHIPGSVHFDIDAAMYPGEFERFSMYPPAEFEQYAQLLGINQSDHLVFYSRGPFGGMMFSSKAYWLFRSYGHEKLSILDGGFAAWQKEGQEVEKSKDYPQVQKGNWKAKDTVAQFIMPFEEFNKEGGVLDHPDQYNLLDSRIRAQFDGKQDTGLDPNKVNGTRIPHTTNIPASEAVGDDGLLKPLEELKKGLFAPEDPTKPVITYCNTGMQASVISVLQDALFPDHPARMYNGGLMEMAQRAPKRISDGPQHLVE